MPLRVPSLWLSILKQDQDLKTFKIETDADLVGRTRSFSRKNDEAQPCQQCPLNFMYSNDYEAVYFYDEPPMDTEVDNILEADEESSS